MTGTDQSSVPAPPHQPGEPVEPPRRGEGQPVNLLPRSSALKAAIRRYSLIAERDRRRVDAALKKFTARPDRDSLQGVATALTPPLTVSYQTWAANVIEIGDWLHSIKRHAPYGLFTSLFKDAANALEDPIPMSVKMGQMYMRVAAHPYVREPKHWKHLPLENVSILDAMLRAAPDHDTLAQLVATGRIHPQMTRTEALALRPRPWGPSTGATDPLLELRRSYETVLRKGPQVRPELVAWMRRQLEQLEHEAREAPRPGEVDAVAEDELDIMEDEAPAAEDPRALVPGPRRPPDRADQIREPRRRRESATPSTTLRHRTEDS